MRNDGSVIFFLEIRRHLSGDATFTKQLAKIQKPIRRSYFQVMQKPSPSPVGLPSPEK